MKTIFLILVGIAVSIHAGTNSTVAVSIFFNEKALTVAQLEAQARSALKTKHFELDADYKGALNITVSPRPECVLIFTKGLKDPFYVVKFNQRGAISEVRTQKPKEISPEFLSDPEKKEIEKQVQNNSD
jgi:hypothetical protein